MSYRTRTEAWRIARCMNMGYNLAGLYAWLVTGVAVEIPHCTHRGRNQTFDGVFSAFNGVRELP